MAARCPISRERLSEIQREIEQQLQRKQRYYVYEVPCDCGHVQELRHAMESKPFDHLVFCHACLEMRRAQFGEVKKVSPDHR